MAEIKDENYYQVTGYMLTKLKLKGAELIVYAIINGFSQAEDTYFTGSLNYLAEFAGISRRTAITVLQKLCEKKLIEKTVITENNQTFCKYRVVQNLHGDGEKIALGECKNCTGDGEKIAPNNKYNNKINNKLDNIYMHEKEPKQTSFQKPTVQEIIDYIQENSYNVNAEQFYDFYESKGWLVGKSKMKDWKACVRTWQRNSNKQQNNYYASKNIGKPECDRFTDEKIQCEF